MSSNRKRIGDLLIQSGVITRAQFEKAIEIQNAGAEDSRHKKRRLGKILVELGFVTESRLADTLALQLSIPRVELSAEVIPAEVLQLVPSEVAESNVLIPVRRKDNQLMVAMSDPLDLLAMDDIRFRTGLEVKACVSTESDLRAAIDRCYKVEDAVDDILKLSTDLSDLEIVKESDDESQAPQVLQQMSQTAPIVKLVSTIIMDAIRRRATDIHLTPHETFVQVRYRIDGNLQDTLKLPKRIQAPVISRIKILGNMDIAVRLSPQDGSTRLRFGKNHVDLRLSSLPATFGETVVIRILDRSRGLLPLPKLGVPDPLFKKLQEAGSKSQGMILVTGPTGSGKTTTLYAFLQWLQDPAVNIITVEDPVEYSIPGITQVSVREQAGLGFPQFMRSALRQDPDIILVGEVRDIETAEIAIRAALTGHLVMTTLHTNDTIASIIRLVDLGIPPFLISSSLTFLVAQRLVRRICSHCKEEIPYPEGELPDEFPRLSHCYRGRGCPNCGYSGYHGQVGVFEFLEVSAAIKRLIANNASESTLREEARKEGMISLFEDAWKKVAEGITTIAEVMGKVPYYASAQGGAIRLPAATGPRAHRSGSRAAILLVDSIRENIQFFQSEVEPAGYQIITCDWATAHETICRINPDLIVLNLDLPGADWPELSQKLQRSMWTVTIPVLLLKSGTEWTADVEELRAGAAGVLRRPMEAHQILSHLEKALKPN
jgi:type IV pilus assembly protein PilB